MPKPPRPERDDDQGSEASYYSYSEYTVPASEVSVNRRWYNRLDSWRKDISPTTPKNIQPDRLSPLPPSNHNVRQRGIDSRAEDTASTVSPKESISSRPSPRIGPVTNPLRPVPSIEQAATLLREEPRIMQDGRMDTVRVYDMGDGIEARVIPEAVKRDPTPRDTLIDVGRNHLGLIPRTTHQDTHARYDDMARAIRLPPSEGTFYSPRASQAGKLGPIMEPYRIETTESMADARMRIAGYQVEEDGRRRTVVERDLPPLPPSTSKFYDDRKQRPQSQQSRRMPPSFDDTRGSSEPTSDLVASAREKNSVQYRPVAPANSAVVRLDTILERRQDLGDDKENGNARYRKGTPYPSVRNLSPSEASTRVQSGDRESTIQRVIEETTRLQERPSRAARVETYDPDKEEQATLPVPRKRYPDPAPVRMPGGGTIARSVVSTRVVEEVPMVDARPAISRAASRNTVRSVGKSVSQETTTDGAKTDRPRSTVQPAVTVVQESEKATPKLCPASRSTSEVKHSAIVEKEAARTHETDNPPSTDKPPRKVHKLPSVSSQKSQTASIVKLSPPSAEPEPEPLKRSADLREAKPLSAAEISPDDRARESSHGSAWTDTILSTPESRRRLAIEREQGSDGYRTGSDTGSFRRARRRSPSPPRRRISVQGHMGYPNANNMNNMQPPFPTPTGGAVIHPPMIGPIMPSYRTMIPRPHVMPMVPRTRPAPIMPPPQPPFGWMSGMSPPTPMTGWIPQRPLSAMPPMTSMQNRASFSAPPTSMGAVGVGGIRSTGGFMSGQGLAQGRNGRDRTGRSGQRRSSTNRPGLIEPTAIPQSSRRRRSNPSPAGGMPRRSAGAPRVPIPRPSARRRTNDGMGTSGTNVRRPSGALPRTTGRPSGGRTRPNEVSRAGAAQDNPAMKSWVRNVFSMGRRPE